MKNILCNFSSVLLLSFFISCYTGISNETAPNYPIRVNCKEFGLPIKFINQKSLYYKPKDGTLIETIKKCKSEIHIPLIISTIGLASFYLYAKNGNVDHFDECENKLLSNNNRLYFVGLNSKNQKIETDYYLATNAKSINNEKDYNLYMNLKSNYCQEESVDNEIIKSPYHNFLQIVNKIKELEKELTIYINTHEKILKSKSELEQKLNDLKIDLANLEIHTFTIIGKIIKKDQNGILAEGWAFPDKDLQERPELLSIDGANPAFVNPKKTMLIRKYDEENIIYTHSGKGRHRSLYKE